MKRIFAVSVLSIMTVVSSNAWAQAVKDYNLATVEFVKDYALGSTVSTNYRRDKIVVTDDVGEVQFASTINQGQVSGLTDALAGKVDDTQIANAAATVSTANMDNMVPTVQRMANAIADAVSTGVGAVDLSSRVAVNQGTEKANQVLVTDADGKVTTATTITQAQVENLSTDLDAKFDKANVISDLTELPDGADGTEHVPSYAVYYMTNLLSNSVIAGEETLPFDTNGGDAGAPIVPTLETPNKRSLIDGINSVYDVVKTNKTDIGNKVDKAQVVASDGLDMNGDELADDLPPDAIVPTVGMVEANFIPNVSDGYVVSRDGSSMYGDPTQGKAPAGSYIITVDVDQNGNTAYHWVQYKGSDPV